MYKTVVNTKEVAKITPLPDELKKFDTLELLITPPHQYKKSVLKKRFDSAFKKAKDTKIPPDINIDNLMNEMNDALFRH